MDFIVNNWLVFGCISLAFIVLMFVNFAFMARFNGRGLNGRGILIHLLCGLFAFILAIPFVIGAIVQIIRYANK